MNLRGVLIVYTKEMRDILRDRRTLITMILVPILLYPLLSIGMGALISSQFEKSRAADHRILVMPRDADVALRTALNADDQLQIVPADSVRHALRTGGALDSLFRADWLDAVLDGIPEDVPDSIREQVYYAAIASKTVAAVVELPVDFERRRTVGDSIILGVFSDETDIKSEAAGDRLRAWARKVGDSLVTERLAIEGLDRRILYPFWVSSYDIAPLAKKSGFLLAMMLPYMLMILTMTGGMYPALDITAGEKERNTLETLLAAPVARWHLAVGKFLTVFTAGMVTMLLATTSMTLSVMMSAVQFNSQAAELAPFTPTGATVAWIILLMIPVATLFSAVLIAVAVSARSYKEGQSYVTPMFIAVILPAMVSIIPGIELEWGLVFVPVVNLCLALKEVLLGIHQPLKILAVFGVTTLYAALALFVATRIFQRESVLFRT
ncbi:MAG TPA: ABC transporter permease subunit [Acidobacteriota bacterium]|nr:ABC transporter permease subunit [Acidobacteriota bacterium]